MSKLFSQSQPYELILAILGTILFLALLFILIWNALHKRSNTTLLPFFILPIGMIAYPTIKSLKVPGIEIEIIDHAVKLSEIVANNPSDTIAVRNLEIVTSQLKSKKQLPKSADGLLAVAKAEMALARYDSAEVYLSRVSKIKPESQEVVMVQKKLQHKVEVQNKFDNDVSLLNDMLHQLRQKPGDTQSIHIIHSVLKNLKTPPFTQPDQAVTIARSLAITGNRQQSIQLLNKVEENANPNTVKVQPLKDSIRTKTFQKELYGSVRAPIVAQDTILISKTVPTSNIRIYKPFRADLHH